MEFSFTSKDEMIRQTAQKFVCNGVNHINDLQITGVWAGVLANVIHSRFTYHKSLLGGVSCTS